MRPEAEVAAFLWDAATCARNVGVALGTTSLEAYLEDGPVAWATERQIELVGEALNNLRKAAPELAERVPDLHKIIATRNIHVHGYTEVNGTIVWQAATQAIPALIPTLEALLAEVVPPRLTRSPKHVEVGQASRPMGSGGAGPVHAATRDAFLPSQEKST